MVQHLTPHGYLLIAPLGGQFFVSSGGQFIVSPDTRMPPWIGTFLVFATRGLRVNPKSIEAIYQKELKRHRQEMGELVQQIDGLKKPALFSARKRAQALSKNRA